MIPLIDSHFHLGSDYWLHTHGETTLTRTSTYQDVSSVSEQLADRGISLEAVAAVPWPSAAPGENAVATYAAENQWLLGEVSGTNAVAFLGVNPHSPSSIRVALDIAQTNPVSVRGVKIHPILTETDLPWLGTQKDFFAEIRHMQLIILIHTGSGREHLIGRSQRPIQATAVDCLALAELYPDNVFIFDHCLRLSDPCLSRVREYPNVYVDSAALSCHQNWAEGSDKNIYPGQDSHYLCELKPTGVWEHLVNELNLVDHLLFASDYPYTLWWAATYWDELSPLWEAHIPAQARHQIAFGNGDTLLHCRS